MDIMEILKVSSKSNPSKVAGAIANIFRNNKGGFMKEKWDLFNKNGKLYGYNTDYYGFLKVLEENFNIEELISQNVLLMGTGGASKAVSEALINKNIPYKQVSRKKGYDYLYSEVSDITFDLAINATPVGVYPNIKDKLEIKAKSIIDLIYNPLRTRLFIDSCENGVTGLDMLIYQAMEAYKLFTLSDAKDFEEIKKFLLSKTKNIVLIGLPGSGKSTIGINLSTRLNKKYIDSDEVISKNYNIDEVFALFGEKKFREIESKVIEDICLEKNSIIATGGGVILKEENMKLLKANGIIIYLKRSIDAIMSDLKERPLTKSKDDLIKLELERKAYYEKYADIVIENKEIDKTVEEIISLL